MPVSLSTISLPNVIAKSLGQSSIAPSADVAVVAELNFDRVSKSFINTQPQILFVSEYISEDKFVGVLLVWEKYSNATHYEIFKRNVFSFGSKFERILFLDSNSLAEERSNYMNYIKNILGFSTIKEENIFVMLDTSIKKDRIYEYKVKASFIPQKPSDVEYDSILEGKDLVRKVDIGSGNQNIFSFSSSVLGNKDLAWVISLSNLELGFFGRNFSESLLSSFVAVDNFSVFVPKDVNDVMKMVSDSMALFGTKSAFMSILRFLRGLSPDIVIIASNSIDEDKGTFSFDKFKLDIQNLSPVFSLILSAASSEKTEELSKASVVVPQDVGSVSLSSVENVTKVLNFINNLVIAASYSQDDFDLVKSIVESSKQETSPSAKENLAVALEDFSSKALEKK